MGDWFAPVFECKLTNSKEKSSTMNINGITLLYTAVFFKCHSVVAAYEFLLWIVLLFYMESISK